MARELTVYGFQATLIAVPAGASNAFLVRPMPGEVSCQLKYAAGGSLEIVNANPGVLDPSAPNRPGGASAILVYPNGVTANPGVTNTAAGIGYLLGTGESLSWDGAARYWLVATGATATVYLLRGLAQGY